MMPPPAATVPAVDLLGRAREHQWYHVLELAPGELTEGWFDLRPYVRHYGLPERMDGMRALDVGTWDGFWAFEMERRGAEVVALDVDRQEQLDYPPRLRPDSFSEHPRGAGFELAKEILGSKVERVACPIYDATPEELGTFDLVLCGAVLIHLRDALLAVERIAALCRGTFVSAEAYDPLISLLPFPAARFRADRDKSVVFWEPGARTWGRLIHAAGFDHVEERARFRAKSCRGFSVRHVVNHASGG
jgi:tRNA (mo5U34)-methyltransferase